MPVKDRDMPGTIKWTSREAATWWTSRDRDGASSSSRDFGSRERERSERRAPPPPTPPFMDMASLEPLSRGQRYYHYVQCPVLCLDSNSIYVKGVAACGLYLVFVSFVILSFYLDKLPVLSSPSWNGCCCDLREEVLLTTAFHVKLVIAWPMATPNGRSRALCGLAEGFISYIQC